MKVLYGINSNGQGHINRSRVIISQLIKDGHEVHVLLSGKEPPKYAYELSSKVFFRPGLIDIFRNQKIDISKTINTNIRRINDYAKTRRELIEIDYKENYDVFFTDFEPHVSVIGRRLKKPVFCVDHQHSLLHGAAIQIEYSNLEKWFTNATLQLMQPYFIHCYALDYVNEINTEENITLHPLLEKEELKNLDNKIDNHFIVYLTKHDPNELMSFFSNFSEEKFFIYGFHKDERRDNVFFKKTSRDGFLRDLASSKGIIGNAGFNLTWESCILNKIMWLLPFENQPESLSNALRLKNLNLACVSSKLEFNEFYKFRDWGKNMKYKPNNNLVIKHPSELLSLIYDEIKKFQRENFSKKWRMKRRIRFYNNRWHIRNRIRKEILYEQNKIDLSE